MKDVYSSKSKRDRVGSPQYTTLIRAGDAMPAPNLLISSNPLQQAVFRGCVECVRVLVETPPYFSVDVPCGPEGLHPIHIAAREGDIQCLRYLSQAGACLQKCDGNGLSPLHYGAIGGKVRAVRWLLRHGAKICLDRRGRSPIQVATDHEHMEIVSLLAKHTSCGTPLSLLPSSQPSSHTTSSSSTPSTTTTILVHSHHEPNTDQPDPLTLRSTYGPGSGHPNNKQKKRGQDNSPVTPDPKVSPIQDSSSSGNSSLATTSSGSNSPCSCSESANSDDYSSNGTQKIGGKASRCSSSSFYLHPPKSSISAKSVSQTPKPATPTPTSFYLHPPSTPSGGLLIENVNGKSSSVHFAEASPSPEPYLPKMAPVTPVSATEFLPAKETDEEKLRGGPGPGPSPSPPPSPSKQVKNPPIPDKTVQSFSPPPPPPMPKFHDKPPPTLPLKRGIENGIQNLRPTNTAKSQAPNKPSDQNGGPETEENDYEDIDEIHDHVAQYEETNLVNSNRKLNRSVSVPANGLSQTDTCSPQKVLTQGALGLGRQRVPFIPPNFPDPPQDALIKPSEYLKSIQQSQGKPKFGKNVPTLPSYVSGNGNTNGRSSARVEETIKMLNGQEVGGGNGMAPVPEETNAEDEFEEINPERINRSSENGLKPMLRSTNDHSSDGSSNGGGIKAEELMKVNLRKTPMSRTMSAPPLGRVLPDNFSSPIQNSQEDVRKCNELNNLCSGKTNGYTGTVNGTSSTAPSQAAVIAELAESSQVGGVREWKEELRRRQLEQDKNAAQEMASYYSPLNFVSEVPVTDGDGVPIPPWKRQMMAKKAAEKARKDAEEQRKLDVEAKRVASIPPWRRQLLQRRDSDGKYAQ